MNTIYTVAAAECSDPRLSQQKGEAGGPRLRSHFLAAFNESNNFLLSWYIDLGRSIRPFFRHTR